MTTDRGWGKAGVRLTDREQIARRQRAGKLRRVAAQDEAASYRHWLQGRIVPDRITAALDCQGLEGPDVDVACLAQEPDVDMWEEGTRYPTWEQLLALCELTGMTPRFFTMRATENIAGKSSLRFHVHPSELAELNQPPVTHFTPEAVAAVVPEMTP